MATDTVTLGLGGEVPFREYAAAIRHFQALIDALSSSASSAINWTVHDLQVSSALATVRGEADDMASVERIAHDYVVVGKALEQSQPIPFSDQVSRHARAITGLLSEHALWVRFETAEDEALIATPTPAITTSLTSAYGAITGRIQTLTSRRGLRFVLYDRQHDRAVSCYLQEGQEERMREIWGHRAIVEGIVTREFPSGRPLTIRRVTDLRLSPDAERGSYLRARGAVAPVTQEKPEETISRLRDAS